MSDAENAQDIPVPTRLSNVENVLEKILSMLGAASPVASLIPGAGPIIAAVEGVGTAVDEVLHEFDPANNATGVDAAALAAGQITKSTGDPALDMRLAEIEMLLHAAIPVVKTIAKHFGIDLSALEIAPQPMTGA